ncbi:hypothetical protein ColTof4_13580 [Colletotrichum tofieldiae]|nr:hypothetical protein ColTof3_14529 [Colletotrichum tofieldiae]GKT81157.1 hypothetical protein ColTof4_13580 [Colletotrichum tofieldiae]GKT97332.1 hypothetical protein Ct61P_15182 [Colletotrichum tofieldiae]
MNKGDYICRFCGLARIKSKAEYKDVKIGLDQAPELLLCKCKPPEDSIISIKQRTMSAGLHTTKSFKKSVTKSPLETTMAVSFVSISDLPSRRSKSG